MLKSCTVKVNDMSVLRVSFTSAL